MKYKLFLTLAAVLVMSFGVINAQDENSFTLDHVDGLLTGDPTAIEAGVPVTFYLRLNNAASPNEGNIVGATNGFRIYSPDGANWTPITHVPYWDLVSCFCVVVYYTGWDNPPNFNDNLFVNEFSLTGSGADTVGFGGNSKFPSPGVLPGFSEVVYTISTQVDKSQHGKTLCIDSTWYPPANNWLWSTDTGVFGTLEPNWDGPHCFKIVDPDAPTGSNFVIDPTTLAFEGIAGQANPASKALSIDSDGDPLAYTVTSNMPWLTVDVAGGNTPATVNVSANTALAGEGSHTGMLTITSATALNSPQTVQVTFNVDPPLPVITCPDGTVTGNACVGQPFCFDLPITGATTVTVTGDATATWENGVVCFTPTVPGTKEAGSESKQLDIYNFTVLAINPTGPATCNLTVDVTLDFVPAMTCPLDPANIVVDAPEQFCFPLFEITGATDTTVSEGASLVDGELCFDIDTTGVYIYTVTSSNACGENFCVYVFDVVVSQSLIVVPDSLHFVAFVGGDNPTDKVFNVMETNGGAIDFTAAAQQVPENFASIDKTSGTTPEEITVSVDISGFTEAGTHVSSILITPSEVTISPMEIPVVLVLSDSPKHIAAEPDTLFFSGEEGSDLFPIVDTIFINMATPEQVLDTVSFSIATDGVVDWLSFNKTAGMAPDYVLVTPSSDGVAPGAYYAKIYVSSDDAVDSPDSVIVEMTVTEVPKILVASPHSISWSMFIGDPTPGPRSFNITEAIGREIPFEIDVPIDADWFTLNTTSGTTPETITATLVDPVTLGLGFHSVDLTITSSETGNTEMVTLNLNIQEIMINDQDTMFVSTVPAVPGATVVVPVTLAVHYCVVYDIMGYLTWSSTSPYLNFVSATVAGTDIADWGVNIFEENDTLFFNDTTGFGSMVLDSRNEAYTILLLTFEVDQNAPEGFYPIEIIPYPNLGSDCGEITLDVIPTSIDGGIVVAPAAAYACGYVVDPDGLAIAGATVELWSDFPGGMIEMTTTSDGTGFWEFNDFTSVPFDIYGHELGYYPGLVEDNNFGETGIMVVLTPYDMPTPTYEWVNFYCDENIYKDAPLPVGSVIDAFDPDGVHCGQYYVTMAGTYGFMPVYRDDPLSADIDEGADPGDIIRFYVNGAEAVASGSVNWTENGASFEVCLDAGQLAIHSCDLVEGWNLVSWSVDNPSDLLEEALASISDCIELVLGFEQGGLTYDPTLKEFSTLKYVDHLSGYWIKTNCATTLEITGNAVPITTPIPVTTGWNLVSYLPDFTLDVPTALATIHDNLIASLGYDGEGLTYLPDGGSLNTLTEMGSCFGYWVKVNANGTLVYPGDGGPLVLAAPQVNNNRSLAKGAISGINTSTRWINLYASNLTLDGTTISKGAVVTAHTLDGAKVGGFTLEKDGHFGFMPVYGSDATNADALNSGEKFYLEIDGVETRETFTWTHTGDKIEIYNLTAKSAGPGNLPEDYSLNQNYPNPFNPTTTISFNLATGSRVTLEVFNVLGALVAVPFDGIASAGTTEVVWNGKNLSGEIASSGIYFYRITADNFTDTKKMTLLK